MNIGAICCHLGILIDDMLSCVVCVCAIHMRGIYIEIVFGRRSAARGIISSLVADRHREVEYLRAQESVDNIHRENCETFNFVCYLRTQLWQTRNHPSLDSRIRPKRRKR